MGVPRLVRLVVVVVVGFGRLLHDHGWGTQDQMGAPWLVRLVGGGFGRRLPQDHADGRMGAPGLVSQRWWV